MNPDILEGFEGDRDEKGHRKLRRLVSCRIALGRSLIGRIGSVSVLLQPDDALANEINMTAQIVQFFGE